MLEAANDSIAAKAALGTAGKRAVPSHMLFAAAAQQRDSLKRRAVREFELNADESGWTARAQALRRRPVHHTAGNGNHDGGHCRRRRSVQWG